MQNRKPAICLSPEELPSCTTWESVLSPGPGYLASCQVEGGNGANEASWGDDICIGSAQATRVGAISAGEMDVLAQGKRYREPPNFFLCGVFGKRTSLSRNSSNGKSLRRFIGIHHFR